MCSCSLSFTAISIHSPPLLHFLCVLLFSQTFPLTTSSSSLSSLTHSSLLVLSQAAPSAPHYAIFNSIRALPSLTLVSQPPSLFLTSLPSSRTDFILIFAVLSPLSRLFFIADLYYSESVARRAHAILSGFFLSRIVTARTCSWSELGDFVRTSAGGLSRPRSSFFFFSSRYLSLSYSGRVLLIVLNSLDSPSYSCPSLLTCHSSGTPLNPPDLLSLSLSRHLRAPQVLISSLFASHQVSPPSLRWPRAGACRGGPPGEPRPAPPARGARPCEAPPLGRLPRALPAFIFPLFLSSFPPFSSSYRISLPFRLSCLFLSLSLFPIDLIYFTFLYLSSFFVSSLFSYHAFIFLSFLSLYSIISFLSSLSHLFLPPLSSPYLFPSFLPLSFPHFFLPFPLLSIPPFLLPFSPPLLPPLPFLPSPHVHVLSSSVYDFFI
ncbi:hypothetical protein C7M84_013292 [Penaeus vannamei]|uniref:Uncharacterized protein n=1 Tax=Penaeus vannamei TaxID=6689 RepID=A0A3R7M6N4_PENVA|nr:hypothetical protein C7M84_013292 [Penaeus vannamei]